jgi:hypothetical protein
MKRSFVIVVGVAVILVGIGMSLAPNSVISSGSSPTPVFIGFRGGDDWEPDIAADGQGHVYVVWAHYGGVPGCATCSNPAAMIESSKDGGRHWGDPKPLNPHPRAGKNPFQVDLQVEVNHAGSVFAAYLDGRDTVVQRSNDFGATFGDPIAVNAGLRGDTDKVGLAVQGDDVYVSFSIVHEFYVASSHDGGRTFSSAPMQVPGEEKAFTLTSGGVIDSDGSVYFTWVSVHEQGTRLSPQDLFLTKSADGGASWSTIWLEQGLPEGPNCDAFSCGWDFLGPQVVVAVDASDRVYVAYNAGIVEQGPPTVWFRTSADGGSTWTDRIAIPGDTTGSTQVFPAIVGGDSATVFVSWQDNRTGRFNTWFRSSKDGGQTWSAEAQVSQFVRGFGYKTRAGYTFPYGDYYGMAWDGSHVHIAWGEGPDYIGPGNVWYATNG